MASIWHPDSPAAPRSAEPLGRPGWRRETRDSRTAKWCSLLARLRTLASRVRGLPLAVVLTVVALAWSALRGGPVGTASHGFLTRWDLAVEMNRTLEELGIDPEAVSPAPHRRAGIPLSDVDPLQRSVLDRLHRASLLRGFSDRSFRPEAPVRWGETLYHWARLVRLLQAGRGKTPPSAGSPATRLPIPETWSWLQTDLGRLAGAGVVDGAFLSGLGLEKVADRARLQDLVGRTIRAFQGGEPAARRPASPVSIPAPPSRVGSRPVAPGAHIATLERLTVTVRDSIRREPIPGAQIMVNGRALSPREDGTFLLEGYPAGTPLDLLFTAGGYTSLRLRHMAGSRPELAILLKPIRASLTLQLRSAADRRVLPGARATIGRQEAVSDGQGRIVFRGMKPGYHTVEVAAVGFQPTRELVYLEEAGSTRTFGLNPRLVP
ncbi:MAG: carboxypeptidase regulatory-like domain-containing protein [Candidatus Riflebacteria bacterium]|nr:carboxypeptidase regulatory-like domain-containing protein [Candidatus Riflebacteria bacterium]